MKIDFWKITGNLIIMAGIVGLTDFFIIQNQTDILKYLPIQLLHIIVGYSLLQKREWSFNIARVFLFLNIITFVMFLPKTISTSGLNMVFYIRTGLVIAYSMSVVLLWTEKNKKVK